MAFANSITKLAWVALVALLPAPAAADPIRMTDGFFIVEGGVTAEGPFEFSGERGFATAGGFGNGGSDPLLVCGPPEGCAPGTAVTLRTLTTGSDIFARFVELDGQRFENVGGGSDFQAALTSLGFSAPPVVAPSFDGNTTAQLLSPFVFEGLFRWPSEEGMPERTEQLRGIGTATLSLVDNSVFTDFDPTVPRGWLVEELRFGFSPIPEPGTLLLVGGGLAPGGPGRAAAEATT